MKNTQLLVLVLNKVEVLETLLIEFNAAGIKGATIINTTGMAHTLASNKDDSYIIASLRAMLSDDIVDSRTIFMVLDESKVPVARSVIRNVVGDLSKPNTGIMFILPVSYVEGGMME
ncbi:MAG: hypothetical protein A2Y17_01815 [Clostridiales bacterium GWF2_38_85]|nr:MAG: hypothetical protein A2Y17_01815 [Clostridiales bacterium GWF2_38_85]HBL84753.1 hypothetical protein [Clostridiales bacterium]